MQMRYQTQGTCSRMISLDIEDDIIKSVDFTGGCPGNLYGIKVLVTGANIHDVIPKLKGIKCGFKPTSCPDQLAKALEAYINNKNA